MPIAGVPEQRCLAALGMEYRFIDYCAEKSDDKDLSLGITRKRFIELCGAGKKKTGEIYTRATIASGFTHSLRSINASRSLGPKIFKRLESSNCNSKHDREGHADSATAVIAADAPIRGAKNTIIDNDDRCLRVGTVQSDFHRRFIRFRRKLARPLVWNLRSKLVDVTSMHGTTRARASRGNYPLRKLLLFL
ncbi:hypothetical protein KM043_012589 [Ampulex compressa]|nr:hypothetical protein KM043_012589 [Ampulex compressa]